MEKQKCKICGKNTKYMYGMNEGIYCEKDKEYGMYVQNFNLDQERWKERIKLFREKANTLF
jgi:hypothetical protein